jgi:hypothetical protein
MNSRLVWAASEHVSSIDSEPGRARQDALWRMATSSKHPLDSLCPLRNASHCASSDARASDVDPLV